MNLFDSLIRYYGNYPEGEIEKKVRKLEKQNESFKQTLFNNIIANNPKNFGFPDVSAITKAEQSDEVKESVAKSGKAKKCWSVCQRCQQAYDMNMFCCPVCFENGKHIMSREVAVSETGILPSKVIRYNITTPNLEVLPGKNCFSCADRKDSFCAHFGKLNWSCSREDWDYCPCKQCCSRIKKQAEEQERKKLENMKEWINQF